MFQEPMIPRLFQIEKVLQENKDTWTLEMIPSDGEAFYFLPGQFNMLYLFGAGEIPLSITGDSEQNKLVHTIRAVGPISEGICSQKVGQTLGVRGPFGTPFPIHTSKGKDVLILAGGIGLAPLRPVIYHILNHRGNYGNVYLLYGSRTPKDLIFREELDVWKRETKIDVEVTVDAAGQDWKGHVGVVTRLIKSLVLERKNTVVVMCGPEVMMRFSVAELIQYGLYPENIYLSMERNMKCAIGFCGHCQYGPYFICKDGAVFSWPKVETHFTKKEL